MKKGTIGLILTIFIVVVVGSTIYYVYSASGSSADIKFVGLSLESSTSQTFLSDLLSFKKFKFTLQYDVLGGFVPVNCRDFTLNIKIEDLEIGSVELDDFQISGWWNRKTETILLDVSHLSATDLA